MTTKAELIQAFLWICHECGADNFERAVTVDPAELEGEDIDDIPPGVYVKAPDRVQCKNCGCEFQTEEPE